MGEGVSLKNPQSPSSKFSALEAHFFCAAYFIRILRDKPAQVGRETLRLETAEQ